MTRMMAHARRLAFGPRSKMRSSCLDRIPVILNPLGARLLGRERVAASARLAGGRRLERLHHELLCRLNAAGQIDWSRGSSIRARSAPFKRGLTGPSPVDRRRTGSKHHLIVDAQGIPLAAALTGANRNNVTELLPRRSAAADRPLRQVPPQGAARRPGLRQPPQPQGPP